MKLDETIWLDATAQAQLVRDGEVSPLELVDAAIARIEKLNPQLNAVIYERFDEARRVAAENKLPDGPLRGVPFLMKDAVQTVQGQPMSFGIKALKDLNYRAPLTTYVAQKFIDAGLVTLGQTAVPLFGIITSAETEAWGVTRNPWNPDHGAGGSSTGAAVAVSSGMVSLAHGNDAGGSIRIPAALCGLVGLKASRGRTSIGPTYADFWGASHEEGTLARTVRDMALGLDVVRGYMPGDPYMAPEPIRPYREEVGRDPGKLRIGYVRTLAGDMASYRADVLQALDNALALLGSLGHRIDDSRPQILLEEGMPGETSKLVACHTAVEAKDIERLIERPLRADDCDLVTWSLMELGRAIMATDYIEILNWRNTLTRGTAAWWAQGFDVLVMPTVGAAAPRIGELPMRPGEEADVVGARLAPYHQSTQIWNITGQPAISLPLYINEAGLPLGVQFIAAYGREDLLIRLASQIEQAAPWHDRHPPINAGNSK